jgi:hypothetical protein
LGVPLPVEGNHCFYFGTFTVFPDQFEEKGNQNGIAKNPSHTH